ncbi:DUF7522 family protein [Halocalculus aciditolerans]|uniref:Uncharacterized protein n=1 Tax=Halocalculus aciditolerans TaxID=1383812 RepID=A0A830FL26_9EURY|nr:hypothetical protein [Halocalculus aciditolerans]GGL56914.1 hypothetical protein GCM10009039_13830 [Halocalculus aciditolerans]
MSVQPYKRLVAFVKRQAGDYFRTAVSFTEDDWEIIYRRADLPREHAEERTGEIVEGARGKTALRRPDSPFGEFNASIELYEDGVFAIIHENPSEGVLFSLERDAARDLAAFIHKCELILHAENR